MQSQPALEKPPGSLAKRGFGREVAFSVQSEVDTRVAYLQKAAAKPNVAAQRVPHGSENMGSHALYGMKGSHVPNGNPLDRSAKQEPVIVISGFNEAQTQELGQPGFESAGIVNARRMDGTAAQVREGGCQVRGDPARTHRKVSHLGCVRGNQRVRQPIRQRRRGQHASCRRRHRVNFADHADGLRVQGLR